MPTTTPRLETFAVLAGAYADKSLKSCLTHVCEVDANGSPTRVLCKSVKLESICPDGYSEEELAAVATCKTCARRDSRLHAKVIKTWSDAERAAMPTEPRLKRMVASTDQLRAAILAYASTDCADDERAGNLILEMQATIRKIAKDVDGLNDE